MTDESILDAQRRIWSLGDYGAIAARLQPISVDLVATAGVGAGQKVLDIAVGDGNATICAAGAGADVVGIDLTPEQLTLARSRLEAEHVEAELREANAEALPFDDGVFDAVISSMGVIFAPDQPAAAAEMRRVCAPGGTVALTAWAGGGWSGTLWTRAGDLVPPPPPGAPRSEAWGDPERAVELLRSAGIEARCHLRDFHWEFPSVSEGARFFRAAAGPFIAVFDAARSRGNESELEALLVEVMAAANVSTDGTCRLPAPYLVIVGTTRETRHP